MLFTSFVSSFDGRRSALVARAVPDVRVGFSYSKCVLFLGKLICSHSAELDKYILGVEWRYSMPPHATKFTVGDKNSLCGL